MLIAAVSDTLRMTTLGFLFCLIAVASCAQEPLQEFAEGIEKFSADVVKIVYTDDHDRGIISPLSAQLILALLADGANGQTEEELRRIASLPNKQRTNQAVKALLPLLNQSNQNAKLSVANKIYADNNIKIKLNFRSVALSDYKTEIQNVNFGDTQNTVNLVNKWVEQKTNNKILNLLRPNQVNASTVLALVNTLYLNAKWQTPFPIERTVKKPFHYETNRVDDVDTMHSTGQYLFFHCGYLRAKFLEVPFRNSTVSVTFVLPDAANGINDAFEDLQPYLRPHNLTLRRVAVAIPKFTARTYHDFKEILSKLGVTRLFNKDEADLKGISDLKDLVVNVIPQRAYLNITETGTETESATAIPVQGNVDARAAPVVAEETFTADHPFFFFIRESKSNAILFLARYQ